MKRIINFAIVAMMMVVSSCAKDSDPILDTIPADAEVVSMVNVNTSMKHLGIKITEEGIKYPESMKCVESILDMAVSKEDKKNFEAGLYAGMELVDLSRIAAFVSIEGDSYVTMILNEPELVEVKLEELCGKGEQIEGFTCYEEPEMGVIAIKNNQAWIVERVSKVAALKTELNKAAKNPISAKEDVCQLLSQEKDVKCVCSTRGLNLDVLGKDGLICWSSDFKQMGIVGELSAKKSDGSMLNIGNYMGSLDDKTLSQIPQNAIFALAIGIDSKIDWDALESLVTPMLDYGDKGLVDVMRPYIRSINGGVLLTIAPNVPLTKQNVQNVETWSVKFMAQMPQEKIDGAVTKIVSTIESDYGFALPRDGDFYVIPNPESPIKIGKYDDFFVMSNGATDTQSPNENIAKQVLSCHAAAVLNLKDMASVLGFVDGVNAKVLVEDEVVKIDLDVKLPDSLLSLIL